MFRDNHLTTTFGDLGVLYSQTSTQYSTVLFKDRDRDRDRDRDKDRDTDTYSDTDTETSCILKLSF